MTAAIAMRLRVSPFIALTALPLLCLPLPLAFGEAAAEAGGRRFHRGSTASRRDDRRGMEDEMAGRGREDQGDEMAGVESEREEQRWPGAFAADADAETRPPRRATGHRMSRLGLRPRGAQTFEAPHRPRRWRNAHARHVPVAPYVGPSSLMAERQHASRRARDYDLDAEYYGSPPKKGYIPTRDEAEGLVSDLDDDANEAAEMQTRRVNQALKLLAEKLPDTDRVAGEALHAAQLWANRSARGIRDAQPALRRAVELLGDELKAGHEAVRQRVTLPKGVFLSRSSLQGDSEEPADLEQLSRDDTPLRQDEERRRQDERVDVDNRAGRGYEAPDNGVGRRYKAPMPEDLDAERDRERVERADDDRASGVTDGSGYDGSDVISSMMTDGDS